MRIAFHVPGHPVPKQSFCVDMRGRPHGFRSDRVTHWQNVVGTVARAAMQGQEPLQHALAVRLDFGLSDRRRVDADNLSKAVLDACNGILWEDDRQIVSLHLRKRVKRGDPGVWVRVWSLQEEAESF